MKSRDKKYEKSVKIGLGLGFDLDNSIGNLKYNIYIGFSSYCNAAHLVQFSSMFGIRRALLSIVEARSILRSGPRLACTSSCTI